MILIYLQKRGRSMWKYSDLCQAFYISTADGGLKSFTSQGSIAEFFIKVALCADTVEEVMPTNISTFNKWFYGTTGQQAKVWKAFKKEYAEDTYADCIETELDENNLSKIAEKLGFKGTLSVIDKKKLAVAIARQMIAFADGKGESENIIAVVYFSNNIEGDYSGYIQKSIQRYNVMKLIGGDEVPLEDFFVCNTIGEKERVFAEKNRIKSVYLEEPDLQSIRDIYKNRGYDNLKTVLIGSGGCGKSLMLQHLFLKAAEEYQATGILPIFLELRYYPHNAEILSFIVDSVKARDEAFDEIAANSLLLNGKCQLLLDGFDEIDPSDVDSFLRKLDDFVTKYDKVQVVITSRQNEALTGFHNFRKLYVWPFGTEQSLKLIDKILTYQGEMGAREDVINYINHGFLKKDGVFASHPLLLTYVTMKYRSYGRFKAEPSLFYKVTYEALLSGHDDNKKPYDRVFKSVDDAEQFSIVFKEFCALTYKDGIQQLSTRLFEDYFNRLKSYKVFKNPYKMNIKNFKHDVCSTACIMYEKEYDIFYIDPGFQECLFAEYYAQAETAEVIELEKSLQNTSFATLSRFDALDMFYSASALKFKFYVLLPFLDVIFTSKNDYESFMNFLCVCFDELNIVSINEAVQFIYMKHLGVSNLLLPREENYSKTVLLNYLLRIMGENPEFEFCLYSKEVSATSGEVKCLKVPEDAAITGVVIGQTTEVSGKRCLLIDCKPMDAYNYFRNEHLSGNQDVYLVDDKKELVRFGSRITIEGYYLMTEQNEFKELVNEIIINSPDAYNMFLKIKQYYKQLKIEKHRSGVN